MAILPGKKAIEELKEGHISHIVDLQYYFSPFIKTVKPDGRYVQALSVGFHSLA